MNALREMGAAAAIGGGIYMLAFRLVGEVNAGYAGALIAIGIYLALARRNAN